MRVQVGNMRRAANDASMRPFFSLTTKVAAVAGPKVSESCARYIALDASRAALDQRIQTAQWQTTGSTIPDQSLGGEGTPTPAEGSQETKPSDVLWMELEAVLTQQLDVLATLARTRSLTLGEIRAKARVLEMLLQPSRDNPQESGVARLLTLSLIVDVVTLLE